MSGHECSEPNAKTADRIVVLLGASNVTLAWPQLMDLVSSGFSGTTHIYTANGFGRSYVFARSAFAARQLPGILHCNLWRSLPENQTVPPVYALLTDFGNDLLYGSSAAEVAASAEEVIARLRSWAPGCRLVLTQPPVDAVASLGRARFLAARLALFPLTRLTLAAAKQQTAELARLLQKIAESCHADFVVPEPEWYGMDPIHIRRRFRTEAFGRMLSSWMPPWNNQSAASIIRKRPLAETRWLFRRPIHTDQPVLSHAGVKVFAY